MANKTIGVWRIESMEIWDREATDLLGPAQLDITADGLGSLLFVAIRADLDCRFDTINGGDRVEFSWDGDDEGRAGSGRGRGALTDDGRLEGRIYVHLGDDSAFTARRSDTRGSG